MLVIILLVVINRRGRGVCDDETQMGQRRDEHSVIARECHESTAKDFQSLICISFIKSSRVNHRTYAATVAKVLLPDLTVSSASSAPVTRLSPQVLLPTISTSHQPSTRLLSRRYDTLHLSNESTTPPRTLDTLLHTLLNRLPDRLLGRRTLLVLEKVHDLQNTSVSSLLKTNKRSKLTALIPLRPNP